MTAPIPPQNLAWDCAPGVVPSLAHRCSLPQVRHVDAHERGEELDDPPGDVQPHADHEKKSSPTQKSCLGTCPNRLWAIVRCSCQTSPALSTMISAHSSRVGQRSIKASPTPFYNPQQFQRFALSVRDPPPKQSSVSEFRPTCHLRCQKRPCYSCDCPCLTQEESLPPRL